MANVRVTAGTGAALGKFEAISLALAATLGTLPAATALAVALARHAPFDEAVRFAFGYASAIPLWVAAMHWCSLARSAGRAWACCCVVGVVCTALALL